jgi:hypothetical protein
MSGLTLFSPLAVCAAILISWAAPAPAAAQQALTLNCPFDDNVDPSPIWTLGGLWAMDNTPNVANTDPNSSQGNNLNYNDGTDFDNGTANQGTARSPSIDLVSATGATLTFWCRYQTETTGTPYDQRWFRVYNESNTLLNGTPPNGQQLAQTGGQIACSAGFNTWHTHSIDLAPYVGNVIQLEFWFNCVDTVNNTGQGWFIDDVVILSDDVTPPDVITDLDAKNPTDTSITVSWSSPFDDDVSGLADNFDLRRSTTPITDANFDSATQVTGEPAPGPPGNVHTMTVGQLTAGTTYYFAIRTSDVAENTSTISNVPSETTTGGAAADEGGGQFFSGPAFDEGDEDILPCSAGTSAAPAGLMALAGLIALAFGLRKKKA